MAIANTGGVIITGGNAGNSSVMSTNNAMGVTKRNLQGENNNSSKWLPAVSNEKKIRGQAAAVSNTHTI